MKSPMHFYHKCNKLNLKLQMVGGTGLYLGNNWSSAGRSLVIPTGKQFEGTGQLGANWLGAILHGAKRLVTHH